MDVWGKVTIKGHISFQGSSGGQYESQLRHQYSDDRGSITQNGEGESDDYAIIGIGGARLSGSQSLTDYEGLTRNNSQQQSHKYAYLPQTLPEEKHPDINEDNEHMHDHTNNIEESQDNAHSNGEPNDYAHNYFVLEKGPNQWKLQCNDHGWIFHHKKKINSSRIQKFCSRRHWKH